MPRWQRTAAATNGLLTPANVVTLLGLGSVAAGLVAVLDQSYLLAFFLVTAGRLADLLDGYLAEQTGTKGPIGEKFDAGADKLETVLAVIVLVVAGLLPVWVAVAAALPHLAIATVSLYGLLHQGLPHPSRAGKVGMALAWLGLVLLVLAGSGEAELQAWTPVVSVTGYLSVAVATSLALIALAGYVREVRHKVSRRQSPR